MEEREPAVIVDVLEVEEAFEVVLSDLPAPFKSVLLELDAPPAVVVELGFPEPAAAAATSEARSA